VVKTKTTISKLYFTELPEDVQKRYHYDPSQASSYAVQVAAAQRIAAQQTEEFNNQQKLQQQQQAQQAAKQQNVQELQNTYQQLLDQERELLVAIGQTKNAQEAAHRRWISTNINDPAKRSYTDPGEANLPLLEGQLDNVRE
jgi:hypothetical protein